MGCRRVAFVASTGRTATMAMAATLDRLPGVAAFHEGHRPGDPQTPRLPLINLQNGPAWRDEELAERTVAERRDDTTLQGAAPGADLVVDVAFYNAPLLRALAKRHPTAPLLVVFRRCETFVRSATIVSGEDRQPAGWPDPAKALTDRERFVELGRLRPHPASSAAAAWPSWSGVQRNIWLWHAINSRLALLVEELDRVASVRFEQLATDPIDFWSCCLRALGMHRPDHLARCVDRSAVRVNARAAYQVGPVDSWNPAERRLYERLALPLEEQIYA